MEDVTIRSVWDLSYTNPERFAEIRHLQELITHRPMSEDMRGLLRMAESKAHIIFLALCQGERIVGIAQATLIHNLMYSKAFVDSVAVHETLRGQGYGKVLMKALETYVRAQWPSVRKMILTSAEKRGTRSFYTGLGYVPREGESATLFYERELN
jgi:GNAT superfamily N-acetyltransferase